jgi:hypothetical protein
VAWLQPGAAPKAENTAAFRLTGDEWQTVTGDVPAKGPIGILRLYLPAVQQPVEVDWIELKPSKGPPRRWNF